MQKFSELEYKRPSIKQTKRDYAVLLRDFKKAPDYACAKDAYLKIDEIDAELSTTFVLASVRNTMNTADAFYDGEMKFLNRAASTLIPMQKKMLTALLGSPFRPDFEKEFGAHMFSDPEIDLKLANKKIVFNTIRESMLCNEYKKTAAACGVDFRGERCNFYGLLKQMENDDREERKEAFLAWGTLYKNAAPKLDKLYDKLVKLRKKMAKKLKLNDYIEMAYLGKHRVDYTRDDVAKFREQVVKYLVPACEQLRKKQAERIGVDKLNYYDETFFFPDGNPNPVGTAEELVEKAQNMYHELSPESGEFFDFMVEYELFDLKTRPGKHLGGYCTSLSKYKAPFIFSNFNGTSADVDVLTHEAGHAFEGYLASRCQPIPAYYTSTSEINEIHSMSMEHFTYPWMERFFGENADKYRFAHLSHALMVIPYIVCVDEFQHRVFEADKTDAKSRRKIWRELEQKYLPWRDYDGFDFLKEGGFWMQKQHIFLYPFYYIDYALAAMGAFEFYQKMLSDRKAAWESYLNLCKAGGSRGYFELLKLVGLSNPFEEGTVKKIVNAVMDEIGKAEKQYAK